MDDRHVPDDRLQPPPDGPPKGHGWGVACHLAAFVSFIGVPLGHILGPLGVWLIRRGIDPFADDQGREAVNFQISMTLYAIAVVLLCMPLVLFVIGIPLLLWCAGVLAAIDVLFVIVAAVRSSRGEPYRYPATIRIVR